MISMCLLNVINKNINKYVGEMGIHIEKKWKWICNLTHKGEFQTNQALKCHGQNFNIYKNNMLNVYMSYSKFRSIPLN